MWTNISKKIAGPFLTVLLGLIFFFPLFNQELNIESFQLFQIVYAKFGNVNATSNIPIEYLFTPHGNILATITLFLEIFSDNPFVYQFTNIFLRILTSICVCFLVKNVLKNKYAGAFSGILFLVSYAGIENTLWTNLFYAYIPIILSCFFILVWWKFLDNPTWATFLLSSVILSIAFFSYPLRLYGLPFLVIAVDAIQIFKANRSKSRLLYFIHLVVTFSLFGIIYITTKALSVEEVVTTDVPTVSLLVDSLLTGRYPSVYSFILFSINSILPINIFNASMYATGVSGILALLSLSISVFLAIQKKYFYSLLAFFLLIYEYATFRVFPRLSGWEENWLMSLPIGGLIYISIFCVFFYYYLKKPKIVEFGYLGMAIIFIHLLVPWIAIPMQLENNHQSGFLLSSRYYLVPVLGACLMYGSVFYLLFQNRVWRPFVIFLAFLIVSGNVALTVKEINQRGEYLQASRHEQIWNKIYPAVETQLDSNHVKVIYIDARDMYESELLSHIYSTKLSLRQKNINSSNRFIFVIDESEAISLLRTGEGFSKHGEAEKPLQNDKFYAFRVRDDKVEDITEKIKQEAAK